MNIDVDKEEDRKFISLVFSIFFTYIYHFQVISCGIICVPGELNGVTAVADKPGDILKQENRLKQAEILGLNILNVANQIQG